MGIKCSQAPKGSGGVIVDSGGHVARAYSVVDLGTHTEDGTFGVTTNRKIRVSWELPNELHTFKEENGPQPLVISKEYNFVVGKKSNLRKDLSDWRGKEYTDEEIGEVDLENLIGQPAYLNVVHVVSKSTGNTYAKISSISRPPKGVPVPMPVNEPVYYDIDMGQNLVFDGLPEFTRKRILACNEWNLPEDEEEADKKTTTTPTDTNFLGGQEEDDGVPF